MKLLDGVAAKLDGNPYSPWNLVPHLPYQTHLKDVAATDGLLCPRGQAGLQSVYDDPDEGSVLRLRSVVGEAFTSRAASSTTARQTGRWCRRAASCRC